jgi:hypothetical protein
MKGRAWMIIGAVAGVAVAAGHLPYLAGAARSLSDTALHLVGHLGGDLISDVATHGGSQRLVVALTVVVGVVLPGVTALLLVLAARGTLRLRAIVGLAVVALSALSYVYQPKGIATGELVLALAVAGLAVVLTGPLVVAPLTGLAGLVGAEFLPQILSSRPTLAAGNVAAFHLAVTNRVGAPFAWQLILLIIAAAPFAFALRLLLRR